MRRMRVAVVAAVAAACVAGVALPATADVPAPGAPVWIRRYQGTESRRFNSGWSIVHSPDGQTLYATGQSYGSVSKSVTIAYGADGTRKWVRTFGPFVNVAYPTTIARLSPDGERLYVAGTAVTGGQSKMLLIAYDASTGAKLWSRVFQRAVATSAFGTALDVSGDGTRVFAAIQTAPASGGYQYVTVAYDALTGARDWTALLRAGNSEVHVAANADGSTVYVAGSDDDGTGPAGRVVALDAENGHVRWSGSMANPDGPSRPQGLVVAPDGAHVFVTATAASDDSPSDPSDILTASFDTTTHDRVCLTRYDTPMNKLDAPVGISVSPDGTTVAVTGESAKRMLTVAYDAATGNQRWVATYNSSQPGRDGGDSVALTDTVVVVTGIGAGAGGFDLVTAVYDSATGAAHWLSGYDGNGSTDVGASVTVDPATGRAYVTGVAFGDNETTLVTLAYDTAA
jgi:PQQ-like domain